jgi:hypothetical protein
MKQTLTASPRAMVLLAATALSSTPLLAQEAGSAPPPVTATVPAPAAQPAPTAAHAPVAPAAPVFAPRQEVVQPLPVRPQPIATPEAAEVAATEPRRAARSAPSARTAAQLRPAISPRSAPVAPVADPSPATPVAAPVGAETAPLPPLTPVADVPAETSVPATAPVVEPTNTATTVAPWMWIVGGLLVVLAIAGLLLGRRRRPVSEDDSIAYAPTIVAPVAAPAAVPMAEAMPIVEEMPAPAVAASDERPWIRITLEPTATETHGDASIMTYQLIVENEGPVDARDVQVSSFLLRDGASSPMEGALIGAKPLRGRIDVPSGGSVRVEASVTVEHRTEARIVADARYPLPDGGEGHLAARFAVDTGSDDLVTRVDKVLERV